VTVGSVTTVPSGRSAIKLARASELTARY